MARATRTISALGWPGHAAGHVSAQPRTVPDAAVTGFRVVPIDAHRVLIDGRMVELTDHALIEIDVDEHALA